jgi:hypothetical protein
MERNVERLQVLSRRRRLALLAALKDRGGPTTLEQLVDEVADRELGVSRSELTDDQRERILLSFHHLHLPALTDAEIVEYVSDDQVRLVDGADDVRDIIDVVFDD